MTTYEDLTPYVNHPYARHGELNIGWLGPESVFEKGKASEQFTAALAKVIVKQQVHRSRGVHRCELCPDDEDSLPTAEHGTKRRVLGSSEIRVTGADGTVYAAPSLVLHYVQVHDYLPPNEFVEAVLTPAAPRHS